MLVERALEVEMTDHLGHDKSGIVSNDSANTRNGHSGKTLKGDFGALPIDIPRDRQGTFEAQIIAKHQTRWSGFDDKIISLYARGLSVREIQGHLEEMHGAEVSPTLISSVMDAVSDDVKAWQARQLDALYPILYLDCIHVKASGSNMTALSLSVWPWRPRCRILLSRDSPALSLKTDLRLRGPFVPGMWRFTCDRHAGLPSETLIARDEWLPQLLVNFRNLLHDLATHRLTFADIGRRLTVRDLDSTALTPAHSIWRVDTVHQVKGESIGAVLYIANERHAQALKSGIDTENGRIGYVALTRARDLFWMAMPAESYNRLVHQAAAVGIATLPEGL